MSQTLARPNSKYSTTLSAAVTDTTSTTFSVNAVPSRVPCILLVDPGTSKQEKLYCSAKGVSTITVTRNYDSAHVDTHDLGASIVDYDSPEYITQIADILDANANSDNTLTPKVKTSINDVNGNEVVKTPATASAVNEVTITNAATGNPVQVAATGGDTNINLKLAGKGTGGVEAYVGNASTADVTASGVKVSLTAGENLVFGDACYVKSDGKLWKGDADAIATSGVIALALATISTDAAGDFLMLGIARNDAWNWTVGGDIYLSTTAGALTQTAPSGTDDVIQILGKATHADRMYWNPQLVQVEHT